MPDVLMPRLSDTMDEGILSQWVKREGDQVRKGDVLAVIETDKAAMEMEAYDEGVLTKILVAEGASVRVELTRRNGNVVLAIADDGGGIEGAEGGTGLSIVRALVRDELQGTLDLASDGGLRAEVVFPA